jgi:hypothetical protein
VLRPAAAVALASAPFWLGPSFAGNPLVAHNENGTFVYGDCQAKSDQGCEPPLQVQDRTTCERNPVALDVVPRRVYRLRGRGIAAVYGRGTIDVAGGRTTTTVFARSDRLASRAARALRRHSQGRPHPLVAPAYPAAVLAELKRVVVAQRRLSDPEAIGRALELGPGHVRTRLRVASLLPAGALREVAVPRRSWAQVQHDRQVAFAAKAHQAQQRFGLTRAQVRAAVRRVRGLTGSC